jgi:cell division protein FtsL
LRLAGDHQRLEADRQIQATNLRVERTARERLKMVPATPAVTMYEGRVAARLSAASAPATGNGAGLSPAGARP